MTTTYKNARLAVTTSNAAIYTCPGATKTIVKNCQVANVSGSTTCWVTASWTDASSGSAVTRLVNEIDIKINTAIDVLSGTLVLEGGDVLKLDAEIDSILEATASILEIT